MCTAEEEEEEEKKEIENVSKDFFVGTNTRRKVIHQQYRLSAWRGNGERSARCPVRSGKCIALIE